jgi:hypothetical protein
MSTPLLDEEAEGLEGEYAPIGHSTPASSGNYFSRLTGTGRVLLTLSVALILTVVRAQER